MPALAAGGAETLINTITDNFGVPVHHYIEVDWLGFQNLVEAVDGVPMYFDKPLRDETTGLNIPTPVASPSTPCRPWPSLAPGTSSTPRTAAPPTPSTGPATSGGSPASRPSCARPSSGPSTRACATRSPSTRWSTWVSTAVGALDTELTADDLITLGTAFRDFEPDQLQTMTLDVYDDAVNGQSILRLQDTEANQQRLDIFKGLGGGAGGEAGSVRVAIDNGTGAVGQATEVADRLAGLGFDTSPGTGDAERSDFTRTVVRYQPGNEAAAQFVAAQFVNGADLQEVGATYVANVIVVTGTDYAGVKDSLQPPPTPLGGAGGQITPPADPGDGSVTTTTYAYGEVPSTPADQVCG